jgi:predicted MFS family arabinose efflux permease
MNSLLVKTREFLGLKRNVVLLLGLIVLILTGEKTWERFIPKYLEGIGGSLIIIGGFGFLQNILAAFWSLPGGYIADIIGNKKAFLIFNLMAIGGYVIAIVFTNWIAVFIGLIFFSAWNAISLPASMSLITKSLGGKKTAMGISMHSIIRRFPMMIGPIIGGVLIGAYGLVTGIKLSFGISILLCAAGIFFQQKMTADETGQVEKIYPIRLWKRFDPRLKNLLVSDILVRFCEQIPYVFVVIWCLDFVKVSPEQFGILTAIEMLTAALIYIPVASFSDRLERKPFVVITFIFFSIFPLFLYFSRSYLFLIFAFIIRGLKEFGEPTRKAMIMDLSVKNAEARSFGLYYFARDFIVSFAAFAGGFLWNISPSLNLFIASGTGILGTLYFVFFGRGTDKVNIKN